MEGAGQHAHLAHDFPGGEIADQAHLACQAEGARHCAADLRRDAEGLSRRIGDEHRFDVKAVCELLREDLAALYDAFDQNPNERELSTEQLLHASKEIVPLAVTMQEGIAAMREWARTRARMASLPHEITKSALKIETKGRLEV